MNQLLSVIPTLPGREEEARVLALALVSRQHVCLIGPPGTGKSLLIREAAKAFGVSYFEYMLTKFTLPEEIFGYPDVKLLREEGRIKTITSGKLPEATLAFIDEIFNGSSAILNTLLQILNERMFYDGTLVIKTPLWTCMAASNTVPMEPELRALWDRFEYRVFSGYLPPDRWEDLLHAYWVAHQPKASDYRTKHDFKVVEDLHQKLWNVDVFTVKQQLLRIFAKLQDHGIAISDRRKGRTLIALAASAVLDGRVAVVPEDLLTLKYVIPEKADDVKTVEQIVIDEVGHEMKAKQQLREVIVQLRGLISELKAANDFNSAIKVAEKVKPYTAKIHSLASVQVAEAEEARSLLEEFNRIFVEKVRL